MFSPFKLAKKLFKTAIQAKNMQKCIKKQAVSENFSQKLNTWQKVFFCKTVILVDILTISFIVELAKFLLQNPECWSNDPPIIWIMSGQ